MAHLYSTVHHNFDRDDKKNKRLVFLIFSRIFFLLQDTGFHAPTITGEPHAKPTISHRLPESTGDNKYTEKMVPGYTGEVNVQRLSRDKVNA